MQPPPPTPGWRQTEADRSLLAALVDRIPERIADAHAHLYRTAHMDPVPAFMQPPGPADSRVAEWRAHTGTIVGGAERLAGGLLLPFPHPASDPGTVKPLRGQGHPRPRQHPRRPAGHATLFPGCRRAAGRTADRRLQGLLVLRHRPRRPAAGAAVAVPARVGVAAGARARLVHHPAPDARRRAGRCGQPARSARPLRTLPQRQADPGARGARFPCAPHRRRHRRAGRPGQRVVRQLGDLRAGGAGGGAARVRPPAPAVRHRLPDLAPARPRHHPGQRPRLGGHRSRRRMGPSPTRSRHRSDSKGSARC